MENAAKALLIASGVLIAIIILTIGITLYTLYSNQSKEYAEITSNTELQKFNSKFEAYVGREDISIQEIITVYNLSKQNNNDVIVEIKSPWFSRPKSGDLNAILKNKTQEQYIAENINNIYSCSEITYNNSTGKVTGITFSKNNQREKK